MTSESAWGDAPPRMLQGGSAQSPSLGTSCHAGTSAAPGCQASHMAAAKTAATAAAAQQRSSAAAAHAHALPAVAAALTSTHPPPPSQHRRKPAPGGSAALPSCLAPAGKFAFLLNDSMLADVQLIIRPLQYQAPGRRSPHRPSRHSAPTPTRGSNSPRAVAGAAAQTAPMQRPAACLPFATPYPAALSAAETSTSMGMGNNTSRPSTRTDNGMGNSDSDSNNNGNNALFSSASPGNSIDFSAGAPSAHFPSGSPHHRAGGMSATDSPPRLPRLHVPSLPASPTWSLMSAVAAAAFAPGRSLQGQALQGQTVQGQTVQGQAQQGQALQGQAPPGQAPQGQALQGQAPPGQAPQGQALQGQALQGQGLQGQALQGQGHEAGDQEGGPALAPTGGSGAAGSCERSPKQCAAAVGRLGDGADVDAGFYRAPKPAQALDEGPGTPPRSPKPTPSTSRGSTDSEGSGSSSGGINSGGDDGGHVGDGSSSSSGECADGGTGEDCVTAGVGAVGGDAAGDGAAADEVAAAAVGACVGKAAQGQGREVCRKDLAAAGKAPEAALEADTKGTAGAVRSRSGLAEETAAAEEEEEEARAAGEGRKGSEANAAAIAATVVAQAAALQSGVATLASASAAVTTGVPEQDASGGTFAALANQDCVLEVFSLHSTVICANSSHFRSKLFHVLQARHHIHNLPHPHPHHHTHHHHHLQQPQQQPQQTQQPQQSQPHGQRPPWPCPKLNGMDGSGSSGDNGSPASSAPVNPVAVAGSSGDGEDNLGVGVSCQPAPTIAPCRASPAGRIVLEEYVAPADLPALRALLRFMYTEVLEYQQGVHSPARLAALLRVADRFKAADCVAACRAELGKLQASDIDLDLLRTLFSIDALVEDAASSAGGVMGAAQQRLLQMFRDVVAVIRSPALLAQFLTLPFAAVATLLRSDQLRTDSENSVVVLATLWVMRSAQGPHCSAQQRHHLASCIRLGQLSPSYLCGVLPNLKWSHFSAPDLGGRYFLAVQARMAPSAASQMLQQGSRHAAQDALNRPRELLNCPSLEITMQLGMDELAEYLRAGYLQVLHSSNPASPRCTAVVTTAATSDVSGAPTPSTPSTPRPPPPHTSAPASGRGSRGVQANSATAYFCGYCFGIKLLFGSTTGGTPVGAATADGTSLHIGGTSTIGGANGATNGGANGSTYGNGASGGGERAAPAAAARPTASSLGAPVVVAVAQGARPPASGPRAAAGVAAVAGVAGVATERQLLAQPSTAAPRPASPVGAPAAKNKAQGAGALPAAMASSGTEAQGRPSDDCKPQPLAPPFAVTPSVFATLPPGEEGLTPLSCPINVSFRCCLEALGPQGRPFASATFTGGSFMQSGEPSASSVAVTNFFHRVGARQYDPLSWRQYMSREGKLTLRLTVVGAAVD